MSSNVYLFLFSVKTKLKFLMKTLQDLYPDSKRLKVKITDSVQLQRAINYTRRRKKSYLVKRHIKKNVYAL